VGGGCGFDLGPCGGRKDRIWVTALGDGMDLKRSVWSAPAVFVAVSVVVVVDNGKSKGGACLPTSPGTRNHL